METTTNLIEVPLAAGQGRGYWRTVGSRLLRDRVSMTCVVVLAIIVLTSVVAPVIFSLDPYATNVMRKFRSIGTQGFVLGTDGMGRDMLARMIYGGRLSLFIGMAPIFIAFVTGTFLGVTAGYRGGKVNTAIMRGVDVFYAFPSVLLAVSIAGALGTGGGYTILALTIVFTPPIARVSESVTTQLRDLEFVQAARASGAGQFAIIRVHILGNALGPIFIYSTSLVSISIILSSGLSFLGLGIQPPFPEWGLMLNSLRGAIYVNPSVAILPGIAIFIVSICFNLLSDGLRNAMDVRA